eukprot:CAMPEP_0182450798 /NCGR_PEP_ID=MMETSP1172-20130603/43374_1 /TAXON_ID=708627 /ORGANISM="Timspurckia oligopyrenoides, Strain CCMP3278" /LENGTH=669 /DNA_ID=CAMNT_0024648521 /DNA_START=111 /DNA_END=2120 /DNA_ORIENTATION=+
MESLSAVGRQVLDTIPGSSGNPGEVAWPISSDIQLLEGIQIPTTDQYLWLVVVGGLLAFFMAWGIGANDVANAFATSVGAGSISLKWAIALASVMEFAGAVLMGAHVTSTVRKSIMNVDYFDPVQRVDGEGTGALNGPEVLMVGNVIALLAAGSWLVVATALEMPVSTTHSIIGSFIGVGLAYRGGRAVVWLSDGDGIDKLKGVVGVVASWFISPLLSAVFAIVIFLVVRHGVLRRSNPAKLALLTAPIWYFLAFTITMFFIVYKGSPQLKLDKRFSVGESVGISIGTGLLAGLVSWFTILPFQRKMLEQWEEAEIEKMKNPGAIKEKTKTAQALERIGVNIEVDMDQTITEKHNAIHENSEKFDPKAEQVFSWMQVFTAAFDSFSHGANDVANAIAPFSTVFGLYNNGGVISARSNSKFGEDGTYSGGGSLNGQDFADGDNVPNGESFCGEVDGTSYFNCIPRFSFLTGAGEGASESTFDFYDSDGVFESAGNTCFSSCAPGCFAKYKEGKATVPIWILAMGGAGIVLGLAMWGYRIIAAIGKKLTKITPSRGFSIELGAACCVLLASRLGLPVSTTHCQVGATVGVGLAEGKLSTINWMQFGLIFVGWVATVVLCGLFSAGMFSFVTLSPYKFAVPQFLAYCPGQQTFYYDAASNGFRGIVCSGLTG